ncbi:MAG: 30S ribosomal protein S12 methylthiotransferase RimO, partial [Rhodobacterales bacterium]
AQAISAAKLEAKVGTTIEAIIDDIDEDGIATCRTWADAPEIDGNLFIDEGTDGLSVGDVVQVTVDEAGEYDLWGALA